MAVARVGISGWRYAPWRGDWYPKGMPQRLELEYASRRLNSIELNGSFYSLQRPASYLDWHDTTPAGFTFAVKGGRFITHLKRLADVEAPLANFLASGVLALRAKLGPMLWQLPERQALDEARLSAFLELLPRTVGDALALARRHDARLEGRDWLDETLLNMDQPLRHAVEARHPDFAEPRAASLLREHDVAFVVADTAGRWPQNREVTSDFVYVRLHGAEELYASGYGEAGLQPWSRDVADWLDRGLDVYVYFDNDAKGFAPHDAERLAAMLARRAAGDDS